MDGSTLFSGNQFLLACALVSAASVVPAKAQAQFRVGASVGFVRFQGGSEPANPTDTVFLEPYGPLDYRLRGSYAVGDWHVGLAVSYAKPGLGAGIESFLFIDRSAIQVVTLEPTFGRRILGPRGGPSQLWLEAGPSIGFWMITGSDTRTEIGGIAAASLRQRLAGRLETTIRGDVSLSPSFLRASDGVSTILRATNVSRYGFSIGLDYRL